ncbi:unnamed protein product, partial [Timema podura]|nr:unnamed protein product [Timema podura]
MISSSNRQGGLPNINSPGSRQGRPAENKTSHGHLLAIENGAAVSLSSTFVVQHQKQSEAYVSCINDNHF